MFTFHMIFKKRQMVKKKCNNGLVASLAMLPGYDQVSLKLSIKLEALMAEPVSHTWHGAKAKTRIIQWFHVLSNWNEIRKIKERTE